VSAVDEPRIELAARAVRDLRRIDAPQRRPIRQALTTLVAGAENVDVKPLAAAPP
jgi:phage-related protein